MKSIVHSDLEETKYLKLEKNCSFFKLIFRKTERDMIRNCGKYQKSFLRICEGRLHNHLAPFAEKLPSFQKQSPGR